MSPLCVYVSVCVCVCVCVQLVQSTSDKRVPLVENNCQVTVLKSIGQVI